MAENFVELVNKKSDATEHFRFNFDDISVWGKNRIRVRGNDYSVSKNGLDSLLEVLDIPKPYANRCPEDFLVNTMNFWIKQKEDNPYALLAENNVIRNFIKPEYPYIPIAQVWGEIENSLGNSFEIANSYIGEDSVTAVALTPTYEKKVVDSVVQGGVQFTYSDSWSEFPSFDTYLHRLVCSNGMTAPVRERMKFRISGKSYTEIFGTMKVFLNKAVDNISGMIEGLELLNNDEVTNVRAVIKKICEENGLPKKIYSALLEAASAKEFLQTIPDERITTMHDVINLVTYVGSHNNDLTSDHRSNLLTIGGNSALYHAERCSSCGSAV